MGITAVGHRMKILRSCSQIKLNTPPLHTSPPPASNGGASVPPGPSSSASSHTKRSHASSISAPHHTSEFSPDGIIATLSLSSNQKYLIEPSEVEYTLKLGAGASSKVYKGLYKGKEVAVKVMKTIDSQEQVDEFKKEFQIMCTIRSPYMVTFYGACIEDKVGTAEPKLCMVMEFCSRDSLYHVMNSRKYDVGWDKFFKFALQMTRGMEYLHTWNPSILHRDFKSLNLLVNEQWDCKVADFGLSRFNTADNLGTLNKIRGTFAYCAPEVATGTLPYTVLSDVYSIGIVLWEMATRVVTGDYQRPFSEYSHIQMDFQIMLHSKEGVRPTMPAAVPEALTQLYKECVSQEPPGRPNTTEIIRRLLETEADYHAHQKDWEARRVKAPPAPAPSPAT